jgi:hypothetical protein
MFQLRFLDVPTGKTVHAVVNKYRQTESLVRSCGGGERDPDRETE